MWVQNVHISPIECQCGSDTYNIGKDMAQSMWPTMLEYFPLFYKFYKCPSSEYHQKHYMAMNVFL